MHLLVSIVDLFKSLILKGFGLFQVKFKLGLLSVLLSLLIDFPVLNTLLEPLLHESGVSLQLAYLSSSHFLLLHLLERFLHAFGLVGLALLSLGLHFEFDQVVLDV
jgi:hypothetical protein